LVFCQAQAGSGCTNDLWASFSFLAEKDLVPTQATSIMPYILGMNSDSYNISWSWKRALELRKVKSYWIMYIQQQIFRAPLENLLVRV